MTAGDQSLHEEVQPHFEAMGKANFFTGAEVGSATRMKLVVNMVMGSMLTSLAEGVTLADKAEVRPALIISPPCVTLVMVLVK